MFTFRSIGVALVALCVVGVLTAAAQQQQQPSDPKPGMAKGEVMKVDADAKTISIKTEQGSEMRFSYTDATKVTGADGTVAGLATTAGTKVVVEYTTQGRTLVATAIQVEKAAS